MTFYRPSEFRQQVEILRRFSAEVQNDKKFEKYASYKNAEGSEQPLMELFFHQYGITHIALCFGCPEMVIMEKILSMDLYSRYDVFVRQLRHKHRVIEEENTDDLYEPLNQREREIEELRRNTAGYSSNQFEWTEERKNLVFWLFKMGEDITDIAIRLGCPEWMVLKVCLETQQLDT